MRRNRPFPRGGGYIMGGDAANLTVLPETVLRLTHFDVVCHALVIDGQPVTPARLPAGATLAEFEGSVGLLWPDDTAIILRGVTASLWQQGAGLQIHGTARDDSLSGTAGPDILLPGAGHDSVAPGAGDDAILYTSGTLTILDTPPNDGADHLELTRHDTRSLTFTADGADLLIGTPEGTIRIVNQLATPTGQLERLRLADSTGQIWIDAALMRDFAEGRSQP